MSEAVPAEQAPADAVDGAAPPPPPIRTRVSELLGIRYPIVQAPIGWIARTQLASAVSNAGGLGIIETSSGELDAVREEIALGGQVMGCIDAVRPVADIVHDTVRELVATAGALAGVVAGARIPSVGFATSGDERPRAAREVSKR